MLFLASPVGFFSSLLLIFLTLCDFHLHLQLSLFWPNSTAKLLCLPTMPPARHPIWIKSYIPTKLDGLLFIEAYLRKNSFLCGPEDNDSRVANGFIFVYEHSAGFEELNELGCWKVIDFDGIFEISQSTDSSGLMRKKAIVSVDEIQLCLESYYKPWDTVNGNLVPPTRCVDFQNVNLRPGLATQDNLNTRSPMETIRLAIEV